MSSTPTLFDMDRGAFDAILHRLGAPDAITEALDDYHPEDVEAVIARLVQGDLAGAEAISLGISRAVLRDCIEGSTYAACAVMERRDVYARACRNLLGAARRVADYLGINWVAVHGGPELRGFASDLRRRPTGSDDELVAPLD